MATWSAVEFVGPCRFSHFDEDGDPVAKQHPEAWVQIAAVSKDQTRNTMTLFPQIFTKRALQRYRIDLGKEIIYADHGRARIEAVTSSPRALEGGRPTSVVKNETHHWLLSNEGHEMDSVIDRNATKSNDGSTRPIAITNAYEPSEDSVAQRAREAYEEAQVLGIPHGIMYDSLEAPPEAPLSIEAAPAVIEAVRGDSHWLSTDRIVAAIADRRNPPSRSRRFWYNQIVAAEDAWIDLKDFDLCQAGDEVLPLAPGDEVVLFADMSKSDDATGIVACRLSDGLVGVVGMWQRPPGSRGDGWLAPRESVDQAVAAAFETYRIVAFFGDPSHTLDDETQERYWDAMFDEWHRRYGAQLELWAEGGQRQGHAVMWDMTSPQRTAQFTAAAERCALEIGEHTLLHEGDGRLRAHARNAKRYPNRYGVSLWKGHRESKKKIDLAVCMVGARMVRRLVLNNPSRRRKRSGRVW
ncbi:hypothetical protein [Amycolatopsis dendrobii]|uniref:hypothetical protein n=1 Tax=Amycolatopsis dendrobii TaxID=2760662 RepID=UPI001C724CAD|nr:hypothetical protein [Amycolatopsis dendrobii]